MSRRQEPIRLSYGHQAAVDYEYTLTFDAAVDYEYDQVNGMDLRDRNGPSFLEASAYLGLGLGSNGTSTLTPITGLH